MPGSRFARVIVFLVIGVIVLSLVLSAVASPVGV
jgi:hypothetical protein